MKKFIYPFSVAVIASAMFLTFACEKQKNPNAPNSLTSIQPTFKEASTGTAANPNIGVVTVTGSSNITNPATQNSSLKVGGAGWQYDACATNPNTVTGYLGTTKVSIILGSPAPLGTTPYTLSRATPSGTMAQMIVSNAPGQPDGINWYSTGGTITVNNSAGLLTVTFNNIQCLQYSFLFPVVTVSGALICQ